MNKILLVIRNELRTVFSRKTYLIFAFGIPFLGVLVTGGIQVFQARSGGSDADQGPDLGDQELHAEGYVDLSGLIRIVPEDPPYNLLVAFPSEASAEDALENSEISAYYLIPEDYLEQGEILYILPNQSSFVEDGQSWLMRRVLTINLLQGDFELADQVGSPVLSVENRSVAPANPAGTIESSDCSRPGSACESSELVQYIPSILVIIFYIAIISSSSMLFNSITREKENRTIEILMVSLNPRELLAGKTLALGVAGLLQTTAWLLSIYILFNMGGTTLNLPEEFSLPIDIIGWSIIFFLGGFALYASLMAGAGALVPRMKEAGVASFVVMIPLLIGYMVGLLSPMAEATTGLLPFLFSFFPLTSPIVMIMRLSDSIVPIWQLLLSSIFLYVGAYFTFRSVAAMFHAQNLLSGQPYSVKKYLMALAGRG